LQISFTGLIIQGVEKPNGLPTTFDTTKGELARRSVIQIKRPTGLLAHLYTLLESLKPLFKSLTNSLPYHFTLRNVSHQLKNPKLLIITCKLTLGKNTARFEDRGVNPVEMLGWDEYKRQWNALNIRSEKIDRGKGRWH